MKQIQDKEYAIKYLLGRVKKHIREAYDQTTAYDASRNCIDISILLLERVEEEINEYTNLLARRMQHYSNVASILAEKMSTFSNEIQEWKEQEESE